ncbi:MAG: hypothetical protein Q8S09_00195, partial [Hyphomonas sp.]|nr:hypothetical protein [Hyphomonas sp.]
MERATIAVAWQIAAGINSEANEAGLTDVGKIGYNPWSAERKNQSGFATNSDHYASFGNISVAASALQNRRFSDLVVTLIHEPMHNNPLYSVPAVSRQRQIEKWNSLHQKIYDISWARAYRDNGLFVNPRTLE